jgi:hypothetical protein
MTHIVLAVGIHIHVVTTDEGDDSINHVYKCSLALGNQIYASTDELVNKSRMW